MEGEFTGGSSFRRIRESYLEVVCLGVLGRVY